MKKLMLLVVIFLIASGGFYCIFYCVGIPRPLFRCLIEIPYYRQWMIEKIQQVGLISIFLNPGLAGYQVGQSIWFGTAIILGGIVTIIAGLCVLCLKSKPVITKPTRSKNPMFVVHSMPLGCVNQKRDCRTCKLDIAELIAEDCPLSK